MTVRAGERSGGAQVIAQTGDCTSTKAQKTVKGNLYLVQGERESTDKEGDGGGGWVR